MARRPIPLRVPKPFEFETLEQCEESGKLHRAEVKTWPPPRSRSGEAVAEISARCARCNCHLPLRADNDPEQSGIEVVVLEKEAVGKK